MQNHAFEQLDEERQREAVDALSEHEHFTHFRGDDRVERTPWEIHPRTDSTSGSALSSTPARRAWEGQPCDGGSGSDEPTTEEMAA